MISQLGDWLSYIALSYIALRDGGGQGGWGVGLSVAAVYLAHLIPRAFVAPWAGPLVDRRDRRLTMIVANLICFLLTLGLWHQASSGSLLIIQALICMRVMSSTVALTATQAALPALVLKDELLTANALSATIWSLLFTLGVALGGVFSATFGPETALLIDASTFLVTALVLWGLPRLPPRTSSGQYALDQELSATLPEELSITVDEPDSTSAETSATQRESARLREAWQYAIIRPTLWVPLFAKSSISIFNASGWIAINLIALTRFPDQSGAVIGYFTALRGLGMILGPALIKGSNAVNPIPAQWITALGLFVFMYCESLTLMGIGLCLWGVGSGINWVSSTAALQNTVPPTLLGRMISLDFLLFTLTETVATLSTGWLFDHYKIVGYATGSVWGAGVCSLVILTWIGRKSRRVLS